MEGSGQVWGRAHGGCNCCGILAAVGQGTATDQDIRDCEGCYLSGRTLDPDPFLRTRTRLEGLAIDGKEVLLGGDRAVSAQEALAIFDENPGGFTLKSRLTGF